MNPHQLHALLGSFDPPGSPMHSAPKDRPILAYCIHSADPGHEHDDPSRLTLYAAHAEGLGRVDDGLHVLQWGGGWDDRTHEEPEAGWLPDWWFQNGSCFETPANPVCWWPAPWPRATQAEVKPNALSYTIGLRTGLTRAINHLDKKREAFDANHGRHDPDTGAFEFGNSAQEDYSNSLAELADELRELMKGHNETPEAQAPTAPEQS